MSNQLGSIYWNETPNIHFHGGHNTASWQVTNSAAPILSDDMHSSLSSADLLPSVSKNAGMELKLYEARSAAKIYASKVANFINPDWKQGLYRQLDSLMDLEEWDDEEPPLLTSSFATFLRLMLLIKPTQRPGLGLNSAGHLIAMWDSGEARLTMECLPNDSIRWVLSDIIEGQQETVAIETHIQRMADVMAPFNPEKWFKGATD